MKTLYEEEIRVPSYALSYLVNGDSSGLEEDDIKTIDGWYSYYTDMAAKLSKTAFVQFSVGEDEEYFCSSPEFGLPCTVVDSTILIVDYNTPSVGSLFIFFGGSSFLPDYFHKIRGIPSISGDSFLVTENDLFWIKHKQVVSRTDSRGNKKIEEITICKNCVHKNELTDTIYRKVV